MGEGAFFREYWKLKWFKPWKQWLSGVDIWSRLAWLRLFEKSKHSFLSSSPLSFEFKLLQNCECPLRLNWKSEVSAQLNATFSPILYTVIYFLLLPIPSIWQVVGVPIVENEASFLKTNFCIIHWILTFGGGVILLTTKDSQPRTTTTEVRGSGVSGGTVLEKGQS